MIPRGVLKEYGTALSAVTRTVDLCAVTGAGLIAYLLRFEDLALPPNYQLALLLGAALVGLVFPMFGAYRSWRGRNWLAQLRVLSLGLTVVFGALLTLAVLAQANLLFSRQWLGAWAILAWLLLITGRVGLYQVLQAMRRRGWNHRHVLVAGAGRLGRQVATQIQTTPEVGLDIVGYLDDDPKLAGSSVGDTPVLGSLADAAAVVAGTRADEVWIALPLSAAHRVDALLHELRHSTATIRFIPDIFSFRLLNHGVTEIAGIPVIDLSASPMVGINRVVKAIEDRLLAALFLILAAPLALVIALGVKLTSPGPVIFKQLRHGWDGRPIKVYKFRTMRLHREMPDHVTQATRDDPRITPLGRLLRRSSLDELPQLFNVLQGRMSIVGPRPHALAHNEKYKEEIEAYMMRHKVKPGMTGWAQVNGFRGETDTLEKMQRRVEHDLYYIEHWSLWFDLYIILLTLVRIFGSRNAY